MKKIAIHSAPRSGSTWLGSIFDSHPSVVYKMQPLFSYALKDRLSPKSSNSEISDFYQELLKTKDDFLDQKEGKQKGIIPSFSKNECKAIVYKEVRYHHILNNLLQQNDEVRVIGLIRNPFSVISSWLKAPKEFKKELGWQIEEEWRFAPKKNLKKPEEFNGYEKWKEIAQIFLKLQKTYPSRFYLVQYDDLLINTFNEVSKIFAFCGLTMDEQTRHFLKVSSNKDDSDAYSVFKQKNKDDGWKQDLPDFIIKEIKEDPGFIRLNEIFNWT